MSVSFNSVKPKSHSCTHCISFNKNTFYHSSTVEYRDMDREATESTHLTKRQEETSSNEASTDKVRVDDAMELVGCGFGTILFCSGCYVFSIIAGAEVAVMSIVGPIIVCQWGLNNIWLSVLLTTSLATHAISSLFLSHLGDRFGRKRIIFVAAFLMFAFALFSGFTRNLWELLLCRGIQGIATGMGDGPAAAYAAEISTMRFRALGLAVQGVGWGIGTAFATGIAFFTVPAFGWRGLLITIALICFPSLVLLFFMPNSVRFDVRKGNIESAEQTLKTLSRLNCKTISGIELAEEDVADEAVGIGSMIERYRLLKERGKIIDFWNVVGVAIGLNVAYTSILFAAPYYLNSKKVNSNSCTMDDDILFDLGVVGLADPIACIIGVFAVEFIGRRPTFLSSACFSLIFLTPLYFHTGSTFTTINLTLLRGLLAVSSWSSNVLGAEYFPTSVRSFTSSVVGFCFSLSSIIAGFLVPYSYFVTSKLTTFLLQFMCFVGTVFLWFLKRETKGIQLEQ